MSKPNEDNGVQIGFVRAALRRHISYRRPDGGDPSAIAESIVSRALEKLDADAFKFPKEIRIKQKTPNSN